MILTSCSGVPTRRLTRLDTKINVSRALTEAKGVHANGPLDGSRQRGCNKSTRGLQVLHGPSFPSLDSTVLVYMSTNEEDKLDLQIFTRRYHYSFKVVLIR